jgi:hypothetical protein
VLQQRVGGGVVLRMRVERQHVVLRRPLEIHRVRRQRGERQNQQQLFHNSSSFRFNLFDR